MTPSMKNKEFILEYMNALNGKEKPREILEHYISDQGLIDHILFFDSAFPKYEAVLEEMISEGNQLILRARLIGKHEGEFAGIMPSYKQVDFPFVVSYIIENNKIVSHWLVADQMVLMQQLGIEPAQAH